MNGPGFCFIHGYSGHPDNWEELRAALPGVTGALIPTLAGHGEAAGASGPFQIERCAEDILAALPGKQVLVGHSMGTRIAMQIAACAPECVQAMILIDGSNAPGDSGLLTQTRTDENKAGNHDAVMDDILTSMMVEGLPGTTTSRMMNRVHALSNEAALEYEISMMDWDSDRFPPILQDISCPVLVLQSTSLVVGQGWARKSIDEQPGSLWLDAWEASGKSEIARIGGAGHYVMMEKPDLVAEHIQSFLNGLS